MAIASAREFSTTSGNRKHQSAVDFTRALALTLPTLAAFGPAVPAFDPLFGYHLAALMLAAAALTYPAAKLNSNLMGSLLALSTVWIMVGVPLGLSAIDKRAALSTMGAVTTGLILALACVHIAQSEPRLLKWLTNGWILSFIATATIATRELAANQHLANYIDPTGRSALPAATFYNPNAYAVYLVGMQGLFLWKWGRVRSRASHFLLITMMLYAAVLTVTTGSRLCLAATFVLFLFALLFDTLGSGRAVAICLAVGTITWQLTANTSALIAYVPHEVRGTSFTQLLAEFDSSETSGGRRSELLKSSAWLLVESKGMGVGPGNFGAAVDQMNPPYEVGQTRSPHSFIGEIASGFGLLTLAIFCWFITQLIRRLLSTSGPDRATALAIGIAFIPASFANSGYLLGSFLWLFFATYLCMVLFIEQKATSA